MTKELQPGLGSGALRDFEHWWNTTQFELGTKPSEIARLAWNAALSLSRPIEPQHCNAPNPDGKYLCNKEPHSTGDHVHSFINPDKQNDFYFWPATSQASSEIREKK